MADEGKFCGLHMLPPEIFSHILYYLVPTEKTINVYRWRRRNYREHQIPTELLLVNKAFRYASMDLFYSKNVVAFREMADNLYFMDRVDPLTALHVQFIQVSAPYDRYDYENFADGVEMQSLTGGPIRLLQHLPNLRMLRMEGMGFGAGQATYTADDRKFAEQPTSGRFDFDAIRLLKLIKSPSNICDGDIYCNGERKETTIIKKGTLYRQRNCDIRITKEELMGDAERVTLRTIDARARK